jgi:hypothetical protein
MSTPALEDAPQRLGQDGGIFARELRIGLAQRGEPTAAGLLVGGAPAILDAGAQPGLDDRVTTRSAVRSRSSSMTTLWSISSMRATTVATSSITDMVIRMAMNNDFSGRNHQRLSRARAAMRARSRGGRRSRAKIDPRGPAPPATMMVVDGPAVGGERKPAERDGVGRPHRARRGRARGTRYVLEPREHAQTAVPHATCLSRSAQ